MGNLAGDFGIKHPEGDAWGSRSRYLLGGVIFVLAGLAVIVGGLVR